MPDPNRPRGRRRSPALRALISAVMTAAILPLALSTTLAILHCPDCAAAEPAGALPPPGLAPAITAAAGGPAVAPTPFLSTPPLDLQALQRQMLDLINADRAAAGLAPVAWDPIAALAAHAHAVDMARHGYLSHWNRDGRRPYYRYTQVGGLDAVQENVYLLQQQYDDGSAVPVGDWADVVARAQAQFMGSDGHRANILAPAHTGVGIGIAYNPATGDVRIAQLFVNDYLDLDPLPLELRAGDQVRIAGVLRRGAARPLLNIAYDPFPDPMTVDALNRADLVLTHAEAYLARRLPVRNGHFERTVRLGHHRGPGLYHVRVWVETGHGRVLASYLTLEVHAPRAGGCC